VSVLVIASALIFVFCDRGTDINGLMYSAVEIEAGFGDYPAKGSGFILSSDQDSILIVTNCHVISDALGESVSNINVRFFNESGWHGAKVLSSDKTLDIAFLTVEGSTDAKPVKDGNSRSLSYGDCVYAVGNSAGLGMSISSGIISVPLVNVTYRGTDRVMIQTDVDLNKGGSGGPLFDREGGAIGMMTLRYTGSDNSVRGISYAIPMSTIRQYAESLDI
jgi:S1-C subfamily serine protease